MLLSFMLHTAWFLALAGSFVAFQLWQARQIERDTPPRVGSTKPR